MKVTLLEISIYTFVSRFMYNEMFEACVCQVKYIHCQEKAYHMMHVYNTLCLLDEIHLNNICICLTTQILSIGLDRIPYV